MVTTSARSDEKKKYRKMRMQNEQRPSECNQRPRRVKLKNMKSTHTQKSDKTSIGGVNVRGKMLRSVAGGNRYTEEEEEEEEEYAIISQS